ncbi:hypothetical protein MMC25_002698 [Agyrium rufum]|nr:hypothetical protein [Agyrium rufum]
MGHLEDFLQGQTVELQDGRLATVRFIGNTEFAAGKWIGIELDEATGKNDGAVQGIRYFDSKPGYGMFIRPQVAEVIEQPTPKPAKKTNGVTGTRPQSTIIAGGAAKRQSIMDKTASKRQSINSGSPTPASRTGLQPRGLQSPTKSPTKQIGAAQANGTVRSAPGPRPSSISSKPRTSILGRPATSTTSQTLSSRPARQSIAGALNGTANPPGIRSTSATNRNPFATAPRFQDPSRRQSSLSRSSQASNDSGRPTSVGSRDAELTSPLENDEQAESPRAILSPTDSQTSLNNRNILSPGTSFSKPISSPSSTDRAPPPPNLGAQSKELEDLQKRFRILERKRVEDRERLKHLETLQAERDKFEGIIQKIQAKLQPQQKEIAELKRQLREAEQRAEIDESNQAENETVMEMATLDREMAEETAESLKTELDAIRQKYEELELEVEILREENAELGQEMSPEEMASQGWLQMEKSNEKLKEALMRLRDVTQETEVGLKQEIRELEVEVKDFSHTKAQFEANREKLLQSEAVVEDLRQQLDTALGAEDLIEDLTEKNQSLVEQIDRLKIDMEELQILKELNDELEQGHVEREKELQEDIDYQENILQEQIRRDAKQVETIDDLEYTVTRFRELVSNMQSDLEDMRASQQITEAEATELTNRSKSMMDLNIRLQISASKTQVKAIELELRQLEAQESAEHLAIVQHFLPDAFAQQRDSVNALLRLQRIAFKSNMIYRLLKEKLNGQVIQGHEDETFIGYDVLHKLRWMATTCDRFVKHMKVSDLEAFHTLQSALYELEPVERAFNGWIDAMKNDDLSQVQCSLELQRSIALMTHLEELHIGEGLAQHAEHFHMRALLMQSNLENASGCISQVRALIETKNPAPKEDDLENAEMETMFQKIDALLSQIRSTKVVCSKAVHQIEELKSRSLTIDPSNLPILDQIQAGTLDVSSSTRASGMSLFGLVNRGTAGLPSYHELKEAISPGDSVAFSTLSSRVQTLYPLMQQFYSLTTTISQSVEFPDFSSQPQPWKLLAEKIKADATASALHEQEATRLRSNLQERSTVLAMRDKMIEELSVNVEVLEKRMGESGGRRERLRELEDEVTASQTQTRELMQRIGRLQTDLQHAQQERDQWKGHAAQVERDGQANGDVEKRRTNGDEVTELTSAKGQMEIVRLSSEILMLQGTIRHLRLSAHKASMHSSQSFLAEPLLRKGTTLRKARPAHEAQDVLNSLLTLVTHPQSQVVSMKARSREERLGWRPVRENTSWQVRKQKEELEAWKEWVTEAKERVTERGGERRLDGLHRRISENSQSDFMASKGEKGIDGKPVQVVGDESWTAKRDLGISD